MAGPLTTRVKGLIARIRGAPLRWALAGSTLLLLAAILVEVTGPEGVVNPTGEVMIEDRRSFANESAPTSEATLVTDSDLAVDNEPLWSIQRVADRAVVRGFTFNESGGLRASNKATVSARGDAFFDVAGWDGEPALFVITSVPAGAAVEVFPLLDRGEDQGSGSPESLSLAPRPSSAARGIAPLPSVDPRVRREFAVATRSGERPDLFAVDRGIEIDRPTVRIFSGESGFQSLDDEIRLPLLGLRPGKSIVDVGRLDGNADLFLFSRVGTSDQPEVHVLSGEQRFQNFALQRPLELPSPLPPGYRLALGSSFGAPTIYAVDLDSGGPVELLPLGPRAAPF